MRYRRKGGMRLREANGAAIFEIAGDADAATARELRAGIDAYTARPNARVVVDLSSAASIDASMLGVLEFSARSLAVVSGRFAIVCPTGDISDMFELTGLEHSLPLHATRAEALASVGGPAAT